ncbi:MAG: hypothetical protein CVU04_02720 [Bacteroidetes bacterium HGW-Bacteroidetes-20]|nr:MAG: hypothetical protein CVU04_02720 [Bacteroidetes bacterium HGW-Bacteroidetes-20]
MALYDSFIETMSSHPKFVQNLEIYRNKKISEFIDKFVCQKENQKTVFEVGIGIGTFAEEISKLGYRYTGLDRNQQMVSLFSEKYETIYGEIPPLMDSIKRNHYDLAYSAFVAEHMRDGIELFEFVNGLKSVVKKDGIVALIMPDARSMGIEFWNQDYTHRYPTTERNVSMICNENNLKIEKIIFYRGPFLRNFWFSIIRFFAFFYNYRWFGRLFGNKTLFYSIYQYVKIDIMLFICRKID